VYLKSKAPIIRQMVNYEVQYPSKPVGERDTLCFQIRITGTNKSHLITQYENSSILTSYFKNKEQ
jgi:hypothetical protein